MKEFKVNKLYVLANVLANLSLPTLQTGCGTKSSFDLTYSVQSCVYLDHILPYPISFIEYINIVSFLTRSKLTRCKVRKDFKEIGYMKREWV